MNTHASAHRSFTDPLGSSVFLSSLDIGKHLRAIEDQDLPIETLPTFLHEVTHHWCFNSPVGVAQLLLFFRARRAAWRFHQGDRDGDIDVLDAVERYAFTQRLMQPLAEGLALFAEHDACPGAAKTVSFPMSYAAQLYAQGLTVRSHPLYDKMPLVLAGGRLRPGHIRRKADLLMQPLDFVQGGYLPGYLTVKGAWFFNLLHLHCAAFLDSDFFLQFARAFIYADWSMVGCLLDFSRSDVGALGPIVAQMQKRVIRLATGRGRSREAEEFERNTEKGHNHVRLTSSLAELSLADDQIGNASNAIRLGKERLQTIFHELFDTWPSDPDERRLVENDLATLQLTNVITLANAELPARRMNGRLHFDSDGIESFSFPAPARLKEGWVGTLGVDVVFNTRPRALYVFVTDQGKLIDSHSLSQGAVPDSLKVPLVSLRNRIELSRMSRDLLTEILNEDSLEAIRLHSRTQLARLIDPIYKVRALFAVPPEAFAGMCERMREDGLLPLLDGNLKQLADAAALSLSATLPFDLRTLSSVHNWSYGDSPTALAAINIALERCLGIEPFLVLGDKLVASYI